jgi:hypothetical protein
MILTTVDAEGSDTGSAPPTHTLPISIFPSVHRPPLLPSFPRLPATAVKPSIPSIRPLLYIVRGQREKQKEYYGEASSSQKIESSITRRFSPLLPPHNGVKLCTPDDVVSLRPAIFQPPFHVLPEGCMAKGPEKRKTRWQVKEYIHSQHYDAMNTIQ